jgi:hypothetical protein
MKDEGGRMKMETEPNRRLLPTAYCLPPAAMSHKVPKCPARTRAIAEARTGDRGKTRVYGDPERRGSKSVGHARTSASPLRVVSATSLTAGRGFSWVAAVRPAIF